MVIEPLAQVSTCGDQETFLIIGNRGQIIERSFELPFSHSTLEDDDVLGESPESFGEVLKVISPLGQYEWRPFGLKRGNYIIEDQVVPVLVLGDGTVDLVDLNSFVLVAARCHHEVGVPRFDPMSEGSFIGLFP